MFHYGPLLFHHLQLVFLVEENLFFLAPLVSSYASTLFSFAIVPQLFCSLIFSPLALQVYLAEPRAGWMFWKRSTLT